MLIFLFLGLLLTDSTVGSPAPVLFIIQAQHGAFHTGISEKSRASILKQWETMVPGHVMDPPNVVFTTELEAELVDGAWTYFPLIDYMGDILSSNEDIDWVGILDENTELNLRFLGEYVKMKQGELSPKTTSLFMGHELTDEESTIIHHFSSSELRYPDTQAGIFLSRKLVLDLQEKYTGDPSLDFHIDPAYELADFIKTQLGIELTNVKELCLREPKKAGDKCITYPRHPYSCIKRGDGAEQLKMLESVYTIVSTCKQYHNSRVEIVKKTWADLIPNLHFVSDELDSSIPTEILPFTINTEQGFCNKTRAMLDRFLETGLPWLLIVDDDTMFSPARFAQQLSCYDSGEPTILGQRYGYKVGGSNGGYNYITGGGGKIINRAAVEHLIAEAGGCKCPEANTPEDMHIFGICARQAGIRLNHSYRQFQGRPNDYPLALTSQRKPVSFHKHWNNDPLAVYNEWFRKADSALRKLKTSPEKDEL